MEFKEKKINKMNEIKQQLGARKNILLPVMLFIISTSITLLLNFKKDSKDISKKINLIERGSADFHESKQNGFEECVEKEPEIVQNNENEISCDECDEVFEYNSICRDKKTNISAEYKESFSTDNKNKEEEQREVQKMNQKEEEKNIFSEKNEAQSRTKNVIDKVPNSVKKQPSIININTASAKELQALSGVGEKKAYAIVEYRKSIGKFLRIEDIINVPGIGQKTFEKNKAMISI